jgi:hypothetical protein
MIRQAHHKALSPRFYFLPLPEQNVAKHNAVEGAVVKRGFDQSRAAERSAHVFIFYRYLSKM